MKSGNYMQRNAEDDKKIWKEGDYKGERTGPGLRENEDSILCHRWRVGVVGMRKDSEKKRVNNFTFSKAKSGCFGENTRKSRKYSEIPPSRLAKFTKTPKAGIGQAVEQCKHFYTADGSISRHSCFGKYFSMIPYNSSNFTPRFTPLHMCVRLWTGMFIAALFVQEKIKK